VLLKATAGGGGKGMRLVRGPDELDSAYSTAALEAEAAFGDGSLYLEKAIAPARHVEIQVLADGEGGVLTLGERECSIQRRHQKLIEESPSPALSEKLRRKMGGIVIDAAKAVQYTNAGTFEFLMDPSGRSYFMEANTRLQVEHPHGDGHRDRSCASSSRSRPGAAHAPVGPSAGTCARVHQRRGPIARRAGAGTDLPTARPLGPGCGWTPHIEDGAEVPPHYDSLLGKLIVWDETRPEAIRGHPGAG
jgi:acetyl-CoA carboxylase biotin carboxylase subunit